MDNGFLLLGAAGAIWPAGAAFVVGVRRLPADRRWRPFAWASVAATVAGVVALLASLVVFTGGGTTEAMVALGGGVLAVAFLLGAAVSGVVAGILRHAAPPPTSR
ncbi:hypothetical protein [Egicoccus sp. AB-alg2]|uniref:hypothetical protein n=1 Tax=Egicoccus sp. AB-alg2 TaxID=3242693 RepID=UPI00359DAD23